MPCNICSRSKKLSRNLTSSKRPGTDQADHSLTIIWRHTKFRIWFCYDQLGTYIWSRPQTNMAAFEKRQTSISVLGTVSVCKPQIHQFEDKSGFIDKNLVFILSRNQGNHIMDHLWIQTDHNLDHKCPDYCQPVTINVYDQTMISLEHALFIMTEYGQPVFVWEATREYWTSSLPRDFMTVAHCLKTWTTILGSNEIENTCMLNGLF